MQYGSEAMASLHISAHFDYIAAYNSFLRILVEEHVHKQSKIVKWNTITFLPCTRGAATIIFLNLFANPRVAGVP